MTITKSQGLIRTVGPHGPPARSVEFAVVAAVVGLETLVVMLLHHRGQGPAINVLYLIGVFAVTAVCELRVAVATSLWSAIALLYTYAGQYELEAAAVAGFLGGATHEHRVRLHPKGVRIPVSSARKPRGKRPYPRAAQGN